MEPLAILRANPVLGQASTEALAQLATHATLRIFDKGQRVMGARTPQTHILVVAAGAIVMRQRAPSGGRSVLMGVVPMPAILGDAEAYTNGTWSVSGHANVEHTVVVAIPNAVWDQFLIDHPQVAVRMYRDACVRMKLLMRTVRIFTLQSFEERLLTLLTATAKTDGETNLALTVKTSLIDLAHALAVDRKTIFRHVCSLVATGQLERQGRRFTLKFDPAELLSEGASGHGLGTDWRLG